MNLLSRSLYILFSPRLPRFGREDVSGTAEYYNRLARQHEATMDTPGMWIGRISMQLAVRTKPFETAEKIPQKILHRVTRVSRRDLLENQWRVVLQKIRTVVLARPSPSAGYLWPTQALRTSNRTLLAQHVRIDTFS
jgi:hypothetical protein